MTAVSTETVRRILAAAAPHPAPRSLYVLDDGERLHGYACALTPFSDRPEFVHALPRDLLPPLAHLLAEHAEDAPLTVAVFVDRVAGCGCVDVIAGGDPRLGPARTETTLAQYIAGRYHSVLDPLPVDRRKGAAA
jgi:hypothetical protein